MIDDEECFGKPYKMGEDTGMIKSYMTASSWYNTGGLSPLGGRKKHLCSNHLAYWTD